jgi:hypothetical protein
MEALGTDAKRDHAVGVRPRREGGVEALGRP